MKSGYWKTLWGLTSAAAQPSLHRGAAFLASGTNNSTTRIAAMAPTSYPKRCVGGRVHAKAHFTMSEADAKRNFGNAWNTRLVSGTILSVEEDTTGKRSTTSLVVQWDLPGGQKARRVNVRSVSAGDVPDAAEGLICWYTRK